MTDPSFRKALLEQNGESAVETRSTVLDDLVKADRQHIHRLAIWAMVGWAVFVTIMAVVFGELIVVLFSLPFLGIVLLVIMIASRRSATISQIQASLASIDAQLKRIQSQKTPPTGP